MDIHVIVSRNSFEKEMLLKSVEGERHNSEYRRETMKFSNSKFTLTARLQLPAQFLKFNSDMFVL